jgi:CubicO group peptidase (beta-lactamase class C family)
VRGNDAPGGVTPTAAELIDQAVGAGVVPGAVLAAGVHTAEPVLLHVAGDAQRDATANRPMTAGTVFDLASLTKVVATLPALLYLVGRGEIGLDRPASRYLPAFAGPGKSAVTVRQLLLHISGLPAERRYYLHLRDAAEIRTAALAEPLVAEPGTVFCYSDVGFIALGELAAAVAGCGLDELVQDVVCTPLGLTSTRYRPPAGWADRIAATEIVGGTGAGGGSGEAGGSAEAGGSSRSGETGRAKVGVVHDENAEAMGGVAGHAGLFGTAADLARCAAAWAGVGSPMEGLRAEALRCQTEGLGGRRGLGWGLRGDKYDNMGDGWPAAGAGHTGFTGTSLSVDPRSGLWAVLLTNAVHFGRGPEHSVIGLRKQVHAAVAAELLR